MRCQIGLRQPERELGVETIIPILFLLGAAIFFLVWIFHRIIEWLQAKSLSKRFNHEAAIHREVRTSSGPAPLDDSKSR